MSSYVVVVPADVLPLLEEVAYARQVTREAALVQAIRAYRELLAQTGTCRDDNPGHSCPCTGVCVTL